MVKAKSQQAGGRVQGKPPTLHQLAVVALARLVLHGPGVAERIDGDVTCPWLPVTPALPHPEPGYHGVCVGRRAIVEHFHVAVGALTHNGIQHDLLAPGHHEARKIDEVGNRTPVAIAASHLRA